MGLLTWSPDEMPDMYGKVVMVTGADSGLGFEMCKSLAEHHAQVVMVCRRVEPGEKSIDTFVAVFKATSLPLHVLINNASVWLPEPKVTNDLLDLTLQVNYYSVAYLTHMLLDVLKLSAPSRVVNMTSRAEMFGRIPWSNARGLQWRDRQRGWGAYCSSKLMLTMYSKALAERLEGTGVDVFAAHPGLADTQGHASADRETFWPLPTIAGLASVTIAQPVSWGVRPALYVATTDRLRGKSAKQGWRYVWGPLFEQFGPNVVARPPFNPTAWRVNNYHKLFNMTWGVLIESRPEVGRESMFAPLVETAEAAAEIAEIMEEAAEQAAEELAEAVLEDEMARGIAPAGLVLIPAEPVLVGTSRLAHMIDTMGEGETMLGEERFEPLLPQERSTPWGGMAGSAADAGSMGGMAGPGAGAGGMTGMGVGGASPWGRAAAPEPTGASDDLMGKTIAGGPGVPVTENKVAGGSGI